ncbi:hypothetical protein CYLTODRAFT_422436 [Cylindrobasidium torrendii FP15055 ss-10]|uniref:Transcription factor CBF/NF-Y/archaeal histone domain-containing protein n=1 Tax=Cylindrobasidium torrendii FP15055 ss-10 TaxID=1314674 RepID=A0A0D7BBK7_9AGAR|nr:hypothetical protein CYLTODRAFT_422436 [Cylindrobasidium torrendii FP15055 ss-10]
MSVQEENQPTLLTLDASMAVDSEPEHDNEPEIDELASEPGDGVPASDSEPPPEEEEDITPLVRKLGSSVFPLEHIEAMIAAEGTASLQVSREALYVITVATEEFIKRLTLSGVQRAGTAARSEVQYDDLASSTMQQQEFRFLEDFIPTPISLEEALALREKVEAYVFEADEPQLSVYRAPPRAAPIANNISKIRAGSDDTSSRASSSKGRSNGQSNGYAPSPPPPPGAQWQNVYATAPPPPVPTLRTTYPTTPTGNVYPHDTPPPPSMPAAGTPPTESDPRLAALEALLRDRVPELSASVQATPQLLAALEHSGYMVPGVTIPTSALTGHANIPPVDATPTGSSGPTTEPPTTAAQTPTESMQSRQDSPMDDVTPSLANGSETS